MKKVRLIVVVVTAALMIMGAGYALWSQSLTTEVNGTYAKLDMSIVGSSTAGAGGSAGSIAADGKSIVLTSNTHLKPGSTDTYVVKVKNTGDIYAVLNSMNLTAKSGKTDGLYVEVFYKSDLNSAANDGHITKGLPGDNNFSPAAGITIAPTGEYYMVIVVGLPYEFTDTSYMASSYKLTFTTGIGQDPYGY